MKGFQALRLVLVLTVAALCYYLYHLDRRQHKLYFYGAEPMNQTLTMNTMLEDVMAAYDEPKYGKISIPDVNVLQNMSDLDNNTRYVCGDHSKSPGLGNQMFIYASLKGIAVQYGGQLIVPENSGLRQAFFNLDAVFVSRRLHNELKKKYWQKRRFFSVSAKYFKNEVNRLFVNGTFELIDGYMQSFRYFHPFLAKAVRWEFTFLPEIVARAEAHLRKARLLRIAVELINNVHDAGRKTTNSSYTFVGVHFRLGDIVRNSFYVKMGYTAGSVTYFSHAFGYFREKFKNVIFVIISNELAKARQILKELDKGDLYFLNAKSREVEMATLTRCNHTIMSTGTFSWWIAYLTGGTTIYYKNWPKAGSEVEKRVVKKDYFLKKWIPMA